MIIERDDLSLRAVLLILGIIATVVAGVIFFPTLRERFQRWKQGGTIAQVKKFAAENDVPNALLAIKTALTQEPGNVEVWRMAADFAEQLGDADAIVMREQVVRLAPEEPANQLALARTALRFKDLLKTRETLEKLPARVQRSADYRRVAAALATASELPAEATALLTLVIEENPGDLQARLERSTLALRHGSGQLAAAARGELQALADQPETRPKALRELVQAALRERDLAAAGDYAAQLTADPAALFVDWLLQTNVELAAGRTTVAAVLPALQARAATVPASIPEFVGWMGALNETAEAARWLATLPDEVQALPTVRVARTDCLVALREWEAARALIVRGAYGAIPPDAVQLAFAARVLRDNDRAALQRSTWDEAVRLAGYDLAGLRVLQRLALEWRWGPELNVVLLAIATQHPSQVWAYQALVERHYRGRDTVALKSVYARWRTAEPGSLFVEGNALFLELLTAPSHLPSAVKDRVAELYAGDRANAFFATTHALALWQSERAADAVTVMETLPLVERRAPPRVLYMALFLSSAGRKSEARRYFDLVPVARLLPEEQALWRRLARALDVPAVEPGSPEATSR